MNHDDIIRMAKKAGLFLFDDSEGHRIGITTARLINEDVDQDDEKLANMLAPFAALVAAAEREACANLIDQMAANDSLSNNYKFAAQAIRTWKTT